MRNELQIKFKEIYRENRSLDSIVEYYFNTGGGCKFGIHIVCKYQNEMRAYRYRFLLGSELVGGLRYTWNFEVESTLWSSGKFDISVTTETLIP